MTRRRRFPDSLSVMGSAKARRGMQDRFILIQQAHNDLQTLGKAGPGGRLILVRGELSPVRVGTGQVPLAVMRSSPWSRSFVPAPASRTASWSNEPTHQEVISKPPDTPLHSFHRHGQSSVGSYTRMLVSPAPGVTAMSALDPFGRTDQWWRRG